MNDFIRRHWNLFSIFILTSCLIWIGVTAKSAAGTTQGLIPAPKTGFKAPDFTLTTLEGNELSLSDYKGKVVVLNIWTTWCAFCDTEMPAFQNVAQEMNENTGVVILALNSTSQDNIAAVSQFVKRHALTFPIPLDTAGRVTRQYQVRALPTTFFIGPDGFIRNMIIGGPITEALIKSQISSILAQAK